MLSVQYGNIGSMDKRLSSFNNVFKKEKIGYSAAGKEEEFILQERKNVCTQFLTFSRSMKKLC